MSVWTPKLVEIWKYSPELDKLLHECFIGFDVKLQTRNLATEWEREMVEKILEEDLNLDARISAIYDWLEESTGLQARALPWPKVLQYFVEVQKLRHYMQESDAQRHLAAAQKEIDYFLFGTNGNQHHQHNIREDLTSEGIDSEDEDDQEDDQEDEYEYVEPEFHGQADQLSLENSPKRKRARISVEYAELTTATPITFQQFDELPIQARSKSIWNQLLKANPNFWKTKCQTWFNQLHDAFEARNDIEADIGHLKRVVDVLRQCRQVEKKIYNTDKWRSSVKESGLAAIISKWSDPRGLLWDAQFVKILIRRHKILVTLNMVLLSWIPCAETQSWDFSQLTLEYQNLGTATPVNTSQQLFRALKKYPDMIPREAYPSSIFFLLSLENFILALKEWLVYAMESKGYNMSLFGTLETSTSIYRHLKKTVTSLSEAGLLQVEDQGLQLILRRSQAFHKCKKEVADSVLHNRSGINGNCQTCSGLEESEQCIQKLYIDIKPFEDVYLGCGISLAEVADRMVPLPIPHAKCDADMLPKPIFHPDHFQLRKCEPDEKIIRRCGMHIFQIYCKSTGKLLDFWLYNAFSEKVFEILLLHHSSFQKVKEVKRGNQFKHYSAGSMIPKGGRDAMGGAKGDTYTLYAGMEAVSTEDMDSLFNDAEDSMILSQAARILAFDIFKGLQETSSSGDRIGTSAVTTYLCNNYTSPIHKDDDAVTGLCAQFGLQAKSSLHEYSFIHADYRLYFVSRSNSLWSFNGTRAHGTMLPSRIPLNHSDCPAGDITAMAAGPANPGGGDEPPRVSNGSHATVTKRNKIAADKHQKARAWKQKILNYWESE